MFHMVGLIWFSFLLEGIAEFTGSHLESYHQIMFHLVLCSLFLEGIAEFTCDMIHVTLNHIIKSCLIWFSLLFEGVAEFPGLHSNLIESRCTKSLLNLIKISRTGENLIKYHTLE